MANTAFQFYMQRAANLSQVSANAYGTATEVVYTDVEAGQKRYVTVGVADTNGAMKGEQVEIKLVRDGNDASNTETRSATAILLNIRVPVIN